MLNDAFEKAIVDGTQGRRGKLHQIIVGPDRSGKTTLADEYAQRLFERGLVEKQEPVRCNGYELGAEFKRETESRIEQLVEQARKGVLIVDEPQGGIDNVAVLLKMALITKDAPVIIITGEEKAVTTLLRGNPAIERRLNKLHVMGPTPSAETKPSGFKP